MESDRLTEGGSHTVGLGWLSGNLQRCGVYLKDQNDCERKEATLSEMDKVD